ncbi:MAG: hypothetical protein JXO72_08380 [Vicinamibacteria bacterium]|nr:hypothetical protein [Vicinamibacteria bacterium]
MRIEGRLFTVFLGGLVGAACGYSLVGRGMTIDPTIKRVGVPVFKDATGRPGLDQQITQKVIEELLKRGRFEVVPRNDGVDAVVDGELTRYTETPVGIAQSEAGQVQANRYSIRLEASVRYRKTGQEEPIWSSDSFSFADSYDVDGEEESFIGSDQAMERLSTAFARQLVSEMLEAF